MEGLTKAAEEYVGNEMPDKFGLILDGWTHESEHYLAVFSHYEARAGPIYPLLSLALIVFDAAGRFNADAHLEAFVAFLPVLARYFELREFISADDEEIGELKPSPAAKTQTKTLLNEMSDVASI
ncbi:hypothetical protein F444_19050 [Phytophthora nicotianae P1976]|uniref:Uncharacterized protein n=1 Tax=Phytophthora nicotianae P1976 TaxID=1317066 RepID=A0A080Z9C4_PHYNI|nr:hypothetical protein F444_19050 [Phytophthora nicotianae P1976]